MERHTLRSQGLFDDPVDSAIVRLLQQDSRISNQQIARELDITAAAVTQRIRKLEQGNLVRLVLVSDFAVIGCDLLFTIGLHVHGRSADQVAEELAQLPEVFSCTTMLGRYNVEALVALSGMDELRQFVETELANIAGISEVHFDIIVDMMKYDFSTVPFVSESVRAPIASPLLDELDREIIARLSVDARQSNRAVASDLDITEGTVRSRLKRLRDAELIRFTALTNSHKVGPVNSFFVRIRVDIDRVRDVADQISRLSGAACVAITAGTHNILVIGDLMRADPPNSSLDAMYTLPGVRSVETSSIVRSVKYNSQFAKILPHHR